jgi:hypothetical protein
MPAPVVWSLDQFKAASTPDTIIERGRDSHLRLIDMTLERFDKVKTSVMKNEQIARAIKVCGMCDHWLRVKAGKQTKTAAMRRTEVETLGRQCWNFAQFVVFEKRKAQSPGGKGNLRSLQPGYTAERTLYVASGKTQNPISGSYMHEAVSDPNAQAIIGNKTFSQLTDQDYVALDNAFQGSLDLPDPMDPGSLAKTQVKRAVLFLNKEERTKRLLLILNGLLGEGFDKPFHCGNFDRAFVIDQYGNLYASNEIFDKSSNFNHSTFNAGKDVICAGTLQATQGKLRKIQNNSGHYKPSRTDLHNAVVLLVSEGLDFSSAKVIVGEPDPTRPGKMIEHDYDNAQVFINNRNAPPSRSTPEP